MSSKIEWTQETWNPLAGCSPVSAGCRNCYAANHARRLAGNPNPKVSGAYEGTARTAGDGRAVFTGRVNLLPDRLDQPLRWRDPRRVFVNSMSDLFHDEVPDGFIDQVFAVMALAPQHTFQILTKRPERMAEYLRSAIGDNQTGSLRVALIGDQVDRFLGGGIAGALNGAVAFDGRSWPLPNVWLGTSVEDQDAADERIPHLLRTPAAVRFLSCEPILGPVDLSKPLVRVIKASGTDCPGFDHQEGCPGHPTPSIDWTIIGGESGRGARPCDVDWIRSLVRQCRDAGVPAFVKQLGAQPVHRIQRPLSDGYGGDHAPGWSSRLESLPLEDRKGGDPSEWPEDLRVRLFPQPQVTA